jgi:Flp pilus assembly protein TadD
MMFGRSFKIYPPPIPLCSTALLLAAAAFWVLGGARLSSAQEHQTRSATATQSITIDYPLDKSIFPPEITPPTFLWRDPSEADHWVIEVSFKDHRERIRVNAPGEHWTVGEVDPQTGIPDLARLPAKQAATRTWKPDTSTWAKIKSGSLDSPATIVITGFRQDSSVAVSTAQATIMTSHDPVGAPIFYRDVPLMTMSNTVKGSIQPLPPTAIPLIKWRLRNVAEPKSRVVMENVYTCANCHSFSSDGKTLGIDVDGPKNDKGLYALVPVQKKMVIRNQNVIRWSSFQENLDKPSAAPAVKRWGFMSQVSPNGRYVVTSIGPPGGGNEHQKQNPEFAPGLLDRLFSITYNNIAFTQVFYPLRGILAWYDSQEQKLRPLPGADDPHFVQTSAFWSPDGKYLVFSRALARDPYPDGAESPMYANDPREPQIRYDLYRIPFNGGKGGKAEPVEGASRNGMSNNFPKVSPDGRWIVFVQNHSGLLMRPDSKLYIVPFNGGQPRLMNCNTSRMNSWHSFSPNGRWLAFSSKARSPFTQLMLTHIDENGNDSPAILVENTTASNRAVNIPEFVNIPMDGMEAIEPQAAEVYHVINVAYELTAKQQWADAVVQWRKAAEMDPNNAEVHFLLAGSLTANNQKSDAVKEYKKACGLDPHQAGWFSHLAVLLAQTGDTEGAIANFRKSLELEPANAEAEAVFGAVLAESGQMEQGLQHMRKAVELSPESPRAHSYLAMALTKQGQFEEAIEQMQTAVNLAPSSTEYEFNLGFIRKLAGDYAGAAAALEQSVKLSNGKNARCLAELAEAYDKLGRSPEAVVTAQRALELAVQEHDEEMESKLRVDLGGYQRATAREPRERKRGGFTGHNLPTYSRESMTEIRVRGALSSDALALSPGFLQDSSPVSATTSFSTTLAWIPALRAASG